MTPLTYQKATDAADAVALAERPGAAFIGGGTNLVDLMRETVERPTQLIDIGTVSDIITEHDQHLRVGGAVRNSALAEDRRVRTRYPVLARALLAGASPQIRNMATVGGNLLQRTRCTYFYDVEGSACNKRAPGQGCDAIGGFNRIHAILGASDACIATHPSDMCVALAALDAVVQVTGPNGERSIAFADFHRLPCDRPDIETALQPGELIVAVDLPPVGANVRQAYRKVRDRASYAFALVSVAALLEMDGDTIRDVRIALGGVAHKPWRAATAEARLRGGPATAEAFRAAAEAELAAARPLEHNGFKVELAQRTIAAVLSDLAGENA